MATEGFRPKEALSGFAIVDNTIGPTIEDVLHISFGGAYPSLVILDAKARLRLFAKHPFLGSISAVLGRSERVSAVYEPEYDACFVYPECTDPPTLFHENLHGWLARQNPVFALSETEIEEGIRTNPEGMIVNYACAEGLAELGTATVLRRIGARDAAENIEYANLYGDPYAMPVVILERQEMQKAFSVLEEGAVKFTNINVRRVTFRKTRELLITMGVETMFYPTGFFFCKAVVDRLIRSGMRFEEAYILLAQHIPTTINELKDPIGYSTKLLESFAGR